MGESNSAALTCRDCGAGFPRRSKMGSSPTRCEPCGVAASKAQRTASRRAHWERQKLLLPMEYVCGDCGKTAQRPHRTGTLPIRCPSCANLKEQGIERRAQKALVEARRTEKRREQRTQDAVRQSTCGDCGGQFPCSRLGPDPKWCRPCYREYRLQADRDRSKKRTDPLICRDCGASFADLPKPQSKRKRCVPCAKQNLVRMDQLWIANNPERVKRNRRKGAQVRRARERSVEFEHFHDREIFERDRWRCGICRKRINPSLSHPHPMSASLDHVIPISEGGPHTRANTRAAHFRCNVSRGNRGGSEQLALIG